MTIAAGAKVDAADHTRHYCKAVQNSVQSLTSGAFTAIQFNGTDEVDTLGIHDPTTNNSRFTIGLKLGWWQVWGKYASAGSGTGVQTRRSRLLFNGATGINGAYSSFPTYTVSAGTITLGGFWTTESFSLVQSTLVTDYVELQGIQDSGGAVNTIVSGDLRCQMVCIYLGP